MPHPLAQYDSHAEARGKEHWRLRASQSRSGDSYVDLSALALGASGGESTVIRFCRALGYEGYQEFNLRLAQDLVEPVEYIHENISFDDSIEDLTQKIFQTNLKAVADTVLSVAVAVALGDSCLEFIRKSSEAVKSKRY